MRYKVHIFLSSTMLCVSLFIQCKKDTLIIADPGYAIGVIDWYIPGYNGSTRISFHFYVGANQYVMSYDNGDYGWKVPPDQNYSNGDEYMVQYSISNPNTARLLFSYRVHDSLDYVNDVNYFKAHPPQ